MTVSGEEFIRRYLLHVLPKGFMRIRHFGFLANQCRTEKLSCIRRRINESKQMTEATQVVVEKTETKIASTSMSPADCLCPKCRQGVLQMGYEISPKRKRIDYKS